MAMKKKKQAVRTLEFRATAVKLANEARESGQTVSDVARDLGVEPNTLHRWVQKARKARLYSDAKGLVAEDRARLEALEKENRILKMERDILKKATAFFARANP